MNHQQTLQTSYNNNDFVMTSFRLHRNLKSSFDNINEFNRSSQTSILNMLLKNYVFQESKKIKELANMPRQITQSQRPETAPVINEEKANEYYPPNVPDLYDPFAERLK
jgi:hypothetical protein